MKPSHQLITVNTLKMADDIRLSELLASPATSDEAISFIANVTKLMAEQFNELQEDDQELDVHLQRINLSIGKQVRCDAFRRIKNRRDQRIASR